MASQKIKRARFQPGCISNKCGSDGFSLYLGVGTAILTLGFVCLLCIPFFLMNLNSSGIASTNKDITINSDIIAGISPVSMNEKGQAHAGEEIETLSMGQPDVQGIVLRIVDGDTIVVSIPDFPPIVGNSIAIRMLGCDAPEYSSKDPVIRNMAEEARRELFELIPPGSIIWIRDIQRDKYFRLLARVEVGGTDVALEMRNKGQVVPYDGGAKPDFSVEYVNRVSTDDKRPH